jgi:hypothetical protein
MALAIADGTNDFSFLMGGLPQPRASWMVSVSAGAAVSLKYPDGTSLKIVKDGTTINGGAAFTSASTINAFYDGLAPVVLIAGAAGPP